MQVVAVKKRFLGMRGECRGQDGAGCAEGGVEALMWGMLSGQAAAQQA